jgi:hypothetical protein
MDDTLSRPPEINAVVWIIFFSTGLFVLLPPILTAYTLHVLYYQEPTSPIFDFELENPTKLLWFYTPVLLLALTWFLSPQYRMTRPQITLVTFWIQIVAATLIRALNVCTWVAQDYTNIHAWEGFPWPVLESFFLTALASSRKDSRMVLLVSLMFYMHPLRKLS